MFSRILTSAVFAGAAAGLIAALLQLFFVQPVLLHAELYEGGDLVHFGAETTVSAVQDLGGIDVMRDGLSILFTMLTYTGYAFLLIAGMALAQDRGARIDGRTGILWGVAGFIAFHFAADVAQRQVWWFATVIAAAIAMWLIAFGTGWASWAVAAVLLLAPHVIGAPEPEVFTGPVPTELGALFAARAFGVGMAAWVLLGSFAGFFWQREGQHALAAQRA